MWDLPSPAPRRAVRPSPIFAAFLACAVGGAALAWAGTDMRAQRAGVFIMVVAAWVVSLCLHEFGHAYAAYRAGDRSVEAAGYLTLNPFKYAHPFLSVVLPLVFIVQGGIGLPGGAVYLHRHALRSRAAQSWCAAAGPASNAIFAIVILSLCRGRLDGGDHVVFWSGLAFFGFLQVSATLLNLLPIPGLDGYAIIEPYLDPSTARSLEQVKPFGMIGVFVLLQIDRLNVAFFDLVGTLYDATGAPALLWQFGYLFFQFWKPLS